MQDIRYQIIELEAWLGIPDEDYNEKLASILHKLAEGLEKPTEEWAVSVFGLKLEHSQEPNRVNRNLLSIDFDFGKLEKDKDGIERVVRRSKLPDA